MNRIRKLIFVMCLFLFAIPIIANSADYIPFQLLTAIGLKLSTPTNQVIRSQAQWLNLAKRNKTTLPVVDFSKHQVVVIATGARPSSGYSIVVSGIYKGTDYLDVNGYFMKPGFMCAALTVITYPTTFILMPKIQKPVRFHLRNAAYEC